MDCAHHVARLNEACPLRLAWTNRAVGHSIVAYHETGSDGSQQPGEFDRFCPAGLSEKLLNALSRIHA